MQRCLMDGCKETGVTIMQMVLEMDAGDILETASLKIPEGMTCGELEVQLRELACPALCKVIDAFSTGDLKKTSQNPALISFAPKITAQEEEIDWRAPAQKIHRQICALSPLPGAWCMVQIGQEKKRFKIKRSQVVSGSSGAPGQILTMTKEDLIIACGADALRLLEVQLEGKKTLPVEEFLRGLHQSFCII